MIPSWMRNLFQLTNRNGKASRRGSKKKTRSRSPWRPMVEQLEQRLVPVTISIPAFASNPLIQPSGITGTGLRNGSVLVPIMTTPLLDTSGNAGFVQQIGLG